MNRFSLRNIALAALFCVAFFAGGCSRKRHLSDDELAMVFHDAFLANAYTMSVGLQLDSLKLYEPIFHKYGYSVEDVQETIGNFSRRKSARLSDVVERAIAMLEEEGKRLDREVATIDTVNNIARRRATRVLVERSEIDFNSARDTSKYKIVINDAPAGNYRITFDYLVDSLDNNKKSYQTQSWRERAESGEKRGRNNSTLVRNVVLEYTGNIIVNEIDKGDNIIIMPIVSQEYGSSTSVRIKNFKVTYIPNLEDGRNQTFDELCSIGIFDASIFGNGSQDSI